MDDQKNKVELKSKIDAKAEILDPVDFSFRDLLKIAGNFFNSQNCIRLSESFCFFKTSVKFSQDIQMRRKNQKLWMASMRACRSK